MKKLGIAISVLVFLLAFGFGASVQADPAHYLSTVQFEVEAQHGTTSIGGSTIDLGIFGFANIPGSKTGSVRMHDWCTYTKFQSRYEWTNLFYTPPSGGSCTLTTSGFDPTVNLAFKLSNPNLVKGGYATVQAWYTWHSPALDVELIMFENGDYPAYGPSSVDVRYDVTVKATIGTNVAPGQYEVDLQHWFNPFS